MSMRFTQSLMRAWIKEAAFPAGMEPTGVVRHGQSPEGVNERERVSQSKSTSMHITKSLMRAALKRLRSRRESNPHLRFRKPPFYPLNYGDKLRFFLLVSPVCVTLASLWRKVGRFITGNGSRKLGRISIEMQLVVIICSSKRAASNL